MTFDFQSSDKDLVVTLFGYCKKINLCFCNVSADKISVILETSHMMKLLHPALMLINDQFEFTLIQCKTSHRSSQF